MTMGNQKLSFTQSPSVIYPKEETINREKLKHFIGRKYRLDLIASYEGQFAGYVQDTIYVPDETMNQVRFMKAAIGDCGYKLLEQVKKRYDG